MIDDQQRQQAVWVTTKACGQNDERRIPNDAQPLTLVDANASSSIPTLRDGCSGDASRQPSARWPPMQDWAAQLRDALDNHRRALNEHAPEGSDEFGEQPFQMPLVQNDKMVQVLAARRAVRTNALGLLDQSSRRPEGSRSRMHDFRGAAGRKHTTTIQVRLPAAGDSCDSTSATTAGRIEFGNPSHAKTTRCKSSSINAKSSPLESLACSAYAARWLLQICKSHNRKADNELCRIRRWVGVACPAKRRCQPPGTQCESASALA